MPSSALSAARFALAAGVAVVLALVFIPAPTASTAYLLAHAERNGRPSSFEDPTRPPIDPNALPPSVPSRLETLLAAAGRPVPNGSVASAPAIDSPTPASFDGSRATPGDATPLFDVAVSSGGGKGRVGTPPGYSFPLARVAALDGPAGPLTRPAPTVPLDDTSFFPPQPEPDLSPVTTEGGPPDIDEPFFADTTTRADADSPLWLGELAALRASIDRIGVAEEARRRELARMRTELVAVSREAIRLATATPAAGPFADDLRPFPRDWVVEILPRVFGDSLDPYAPTDLPPAPDGEESR